MTRPTPRNARPNVSKSVARAFAMLALFRDTREPLTAIQIRQQLDMPQPSVRALLKNLVDLGYLNYAADRKTYFPTMQLAHLGDWIAASVLAGGNTSQVIDDISMETGETASISVINDLNLEVLYAKTATHPVALQLRAGIGEVLWRTAAGRTLLSLLSDEKLEKIMRAMARRDNNARRRHEILGLESAIRDIRRRGSFIGYDIYLRGVGTVCVPAHVGNQHAVIAVAGVKDRIQANEKRILRSIRSQIAHLE